MTESRTLQFESPRALQSLYANDIKLLKHLEDSLGVKVTTREGWMKLEGDRSRVDKAQQVFQQLEQARQRGVDIQKHEFNYTLKAVTEERDESLGDIVSTKIVTSSRKPPVVARSANQRAYVEAIQKHDVVFGIGPAGTGKTYLAVAMAVAALKKEQVARIILTRPAVEAGEALGFLPGDLEQKILPYLRPLHDALREMLEPEEMERAIARQTIEVAPLAYMRGRTLSNAFVILDEAQNTTTEQMFMLLTRIGLNSKCVVTGDVTQIDLPANKRSGVVEALQALKNVPGIATVYFTERDVVRHELVRAIIGAYEAHRAPARSRGSRRFRCAATNPSTASVRQLNPISERLLYSSHSGRRSCSGTRTVENAVVPEAVETGAKSRSAPSSVDRSINDSCDPRLIGPALVVWLNVRPCAPAAG